MMSAHLLFEDPGLLKDRKCAYCGQLLRDPVQPSCGHRLCKSCADQIIQNPFLVCCPKEECKEKFSLFKNGKHVSVMVYDI